jgi:hypothetical protein
MSVRTNYMRNPSLESSVVTGWLLNDYTAGATPPTRTQVADAAVGTYGCELYYVADAADTGTQYLNYEGPYTSGPTFTGVGTAATNDVWTLSAYIKKGAGTNSGIPINLRIAEYNNVGTWLAQGSGADISGSLTTSYQRFSYIYTLVQATVSQVTGRIYAASIANGDALDIIVDGILLEKTGTLGDYFDGSTADTGSHTYDWTGTAHNSNSTDTETPGFVGMLVTRKVG